MIPAPLPLVHIWPLDKPKKDPERCSSKRPISLHIAMAKMLEAAVHPKMEPCQYAYRRGRSTEIHLPELLDFVHGAKRIGWPVYIAAVDVDGVFDKAPHAS